MPDLIASLQWALERIETAGLGMGERYQKADEALMSAVRGYR
jgi:hypothetical protein